MIEKRKRLGLLLASLHVIVFGGIVVFFSQSADAQILVFQLFFVIDLPFSLLNLFMSEAYLNWLTAHEDASWYAFAYLPNLVHGVLGTIWWYFLPRFAMRLPATKRQFDKID